MPHEHPAMRSGSARSMQVTARRRRTVIFTLAAVIAIVVAFIGGCTSDDDGNAGARADFTHVSTDPCPDSRFECVTLAVPRDHFSGDATTWEVTFGIQRATAEAIELAEPAGLEYANGKLYVSHDVFGSGKVSTIHL